MGPTHAVGTHARSSHAGRAWGLTPAALTIFQMVEGATVYPRPVSSPSTRLYPYAKRTLSSMSKEFTATSCMTDCPVGEA
jgi:hypothetical protein